MIIAVDFDGVLCEERWPAIGAPREAIILYLIDRRKQGDKLILWTCREGELLADAVNWCEEHGLIFDAVNANLPERVREYGNDCRKIGADEYWDDRSVIVTPAEIITKDLSMILSVRTRKLGKIREWFIQKLRFRETSEEGDNSL